MIAFYFESGHFEKNVIATKQLVTITNQIARGIIVTWKFILMLYRCSWMEEYSMVHGEIFNTDKC
jgi:hypothetical protein